jgi:signal transduction histidine kinase
MLGGAHRLLADGRHSTAILLGLLLVAFVVAGTIGLLGWRGAEEDEAADDVLGRASVTADRAEAFLGATATPLSATLNDAIADGEEGLRGDLGVPGEAWALDERGRIVASTGAPGLGSPPEAQAAIAGSLGVSGFVGHPAGGPGVRIALPLAAGGRAAVVAVVPARFLADLLEPALAAEPGQPPADVVVTAPDGRALVSTGAEERVDERLLAAAAEDSAGELDIDGTPYLFSAAPVGDSPWTALVAGPQEDVLAAADGPAGWLGWALLLEVLLAGLLGVLLLRRLLRDTDRVDRANVALSERSATAEHATEVKSDFISTLAHEMRTPLAAIGLFAEMMRADREEPLGDGQRRHVDDIDASARHALGLLDETLDISRIESGRLELRPERASVAAIGIEVVDGLHPLALKRGIDLSLEADGRLEQTLVDPVRVRQVMTNFLTNALKFTPSGGRVRLRVERHGDDSFEIAVDDTGVGIAAADPSDVFGTAHLPAEPLHPGDEATGFGLAVTKRLVEEMGGTVGVRSRRHQGSTFSAVLPKVAARRSRLS